MCIRDRGNTHPSRASETNVEAAPGPAQVQLRTLEAMFLHVARCRLRIGADRSTDERWADCGLHFGPLAM
eukprot:14188915-Alexandrium_andersonii.AAC.1